MIAFTRQLRMLSLLVLSASSALADGEVVVESQLAGSWRVTLLASPWPLRAGPAEFSVLVQDAISGQPVADAEIALEVRPPTSSMSPPTLLRLSGVRGRGANPLFHSARLKLSTTGPWTLRVRVSEPALPSLAAVEVEVAPEASLFARHGIALSLPLLGVGLFCLHQWLSARRVARDASSNPGAAE